MTVRSINVRSNSDSLVGFDSSEIGSRPETR